MMYALDVYYHKPTDDTMIPRKLSDWCNSDKALGVAVYKAMRSLDVFGYTLVELRVTPQNVKGKFL